MANVLQAGRSRRQKNSNNQSYNSLVRFGGMLIQQGMNSNLMSDVLKHSES